MSKLGENEISVPGLIISGGEGKSKLKERVRVEMFTISPDDDDAFVIESLYNRAAAGEVEILKEHHFTFQHSFHLVLTYKEPVPAATQQPKKDV
ncbi:MAG TPA: hypothetical protein VFM18_23570 [Methanosarcina sp.]|nr:hypothetical protein [Methanosarcina sp.]